MKGLLERWFEKSEAVGLVACVCDRNGMVWQGGLGRSSVDRPNPMDPETTIMNIASVSKLVTGTAVMRLVEEGRIGLDDPVQHHLDFELRHPLHVEEKITVRELLTHTSAIADGPAYRASYAPGDPTMALRDWLREYLRPGGELFERDRNWHPWKPGDRWEYSNVAFGVLGLLVESASGIDFRTYTRRAVLEPLRMSSAGWFLVDIDISHLATPHEAVGGDPDDDLLASAPVPGAHWARLVQYGFATYPDGLLRTTVTDLSRFVTGVLAGSASPLNAATVDAMLTGSLIDRREEDEACRWWEARDQGLVWRRYPSSAGRAEPWGHTGGDPGVKTVLMIDRVVGLGAIMCTNSPSDWGFTPDELLDAAKRTRSRPEETAT